MPANFFLSPEAQQASYNSLKAAITASQQRAARDPAHRARRWQEHFQRQGDHALRAELAIILQLAEQAGYEWPFRSE